MRRSITFGVIIVARVADLLLVWVCTAQQGVSKGTHITL